MSHVGGSSFLKVGPIKAKAQDLVTAHKTKNSSRPGEHRGQSGGWHLDKTTEVFRG